MATTIAPLVERLTLTKRSRVEKKKPLRESKGKRLILDLSPSAAQELEDMGDRLSIDKKTDVVRFALGLLNTYADHVERGYELVLQKGDEVKIVVMPKQF